MEIGFRRTGTRGRRPLVWASSLLVVATLTACADKKPIPLYPSTEKPASPDEVSTLYGDVREVDGKVVSEHGGSFELLPGCHAVRVVETWGRMDVNASVVANLPNIVFALPMQGGYRYVVRVQERMGTGTVSITAHEEDSSGTVTRQFPQASEADIAACRP